MQEIVLVIASALISGLIATVITIYSQKKDRLYDRKMRIFETLMSYRYMIASEESVKALNSIDVIFYKDKAVRDAYKEFLNEADKKQELNPNIEDKHLKLLEVMSQALKLGDIHWDDIKHTYYPIGLMERIEEENALRKAQLQSASAKLKENASQKNAPVNNQMYQELLISIMPELLKNPDKLNAIMEIGERYSKKGRE